MITLSPDTLVGKIASDLPGAAEVFRKAGIRFCCGGMLSLTDAATKAGLAPEALLADLRALVRSTGRGAPDATPELINHILTRYHETHRTELGWLIPLAEKVETVHGDHEAAPLGLAETLEVLRDELDSHMVKEEQVLFPMMLRGGHAMIGHPIAQMRHEHDDATSQLRYIEHVTKSLTLPEGACGSWAALYTGLRKFSDDLVAHIHLENEVLFPRFSAAAEHA